MFVTKNHAGGILFQLTKSNKAMTRGALPSSWDGKFLGVSVEGWRGVLDHDTFLNPVVHCSSGTRVDIVASIVGGKRASLFHGNQIVRISGIVFTLHFGRNFVVRLGENLLKRHSFWVVTKSAKGLKLGHEVSGINCVAL